MPKLPPQPRVLITGGASGLGLAFAKQLAKRKARIVIADVNLAGAQAAAADISQMGATATAIACDVSKPDDLEAAAEHINQQYGGIDLLVNNAGVAAGGTMGDLSLDDWRWIMNINLWGVIHGCHTFVPIMRQAGGGAILNVASGAGIASLPEMAAYNVTKAGVIALTETLRSELAPNNIAVSALCPTFFKTNLMDSFRSSHDRQRQMAESLFRRSRLTADDVARAGIEGLESGTLLILPQLDGRLVWWSKRISPQLFYSAVARGYRSNIVDRLMK